MAKFEARLISEDEFEQWDNLVSKYGTIFQSIRWTKIFEPKIRRIGIYNKGGNLRGGFCYFEERKFGLKVFRNPPFTPSVGPFYERLAKNPAAKTNEQRDVVEAMVEYVESQQPALVSLSLVPEVVDGMPFYWKGYKITVGYTYRINLSKSGNVMSLMRMQQRNHIKKALKDDIMVEESIYRAVISSLVAKTFKRQKKKFPVGFMNAILRNFPPGENSYLFVSERDGVPAAAVYCVHDKKTAYNLMTGYDHQRAHHGAGALAMYHAMLKAQEMGLEIFDFEGSMVPAIEKYFRGFGGELTPYLRVNKAWLPIEIVLKFWKRQLF